MSAPLEDAADFSSRPAGGTSAEGAWLVSFADLISLMLAFFVLLYASSSGGPGSWERMRGSLSATFNPSGTPDPGLGVRAELSRLAPEGRDLDYLAVVLAERLAAPELVGVAVERRPDGLFIVLPEAIVFEPGRATLSDETRARLADLAQVLSKVPNRLEIYGHTDPEDSPAAWKLSIARSMAVAYELRRAGYPYAIAGMGFAGGRFGEAGAGLPVEARGRLSRRVEIIIRGDAS